MIRRELGTKLIQLFNQFPAIAILGPRQSGKTTLTKEMFPQLQYVNLEDLSIRQFAKEDPKGFLDNYPNGLIIDEIQNIPELLSYIQLYIDNKDKPGLYIITGSQQILLNEKISQSLAGRIAITTLLPFSYSEIKNQNNVPKNINEILFNGFYPRIYKFNIKPNDFYSSYIQTYIEKDIRQLKNVLDLSLFQKFLKLCAGRVGQLLNLSSIANDCGISHVTARQWLSLLEMSFIVYLLKPHHVNFNKRLVKTPKLYFYDTGLLCHLLDISYFAQLSSHYAKGAIFENFIVIEYLKNKFHSGTRPNIYFWRDKVGHEIDILLEKGNNFIPVEIKSATTLNSNYFENIKYWSKLSQQNTTNFLIYCGENQKRQNSLILNWQYLDDFFDF